MSSTHHPANMSEGSLKFQGTLPRNSQEHCETNNHNGEANTTDSIQEQNTREITR